MSAMSGASLKQRKQQAMALLQAGQITEAKEIFQELSKDARRDPDVWHLLAACHSILGDYVQCETFARKAIALMPSFSGAWNNLGSALQAQGKLTEAESALREAIKRTPSDTQAYNNLGNVYREMKKTDEAENCYREALRHQPNFPDALTNLGLILQDRGELTEAVTLHRRALSLNAQHVDANYNIGYALTLLGDPKSAIPFLERVTQLSPGETRGWISLGSAYARIYDQKRALSCFERCVSLDPKNSENLATLGTCYLATGEREKSIAMLTRALELNADDSETRYWLAAAGVGETPEKMAPGTVAKLFDGYASNFDAHLVGKLQYHAPALLSAALRRARENDTRPLDLLDLGCGTGLVGAEVRDIAGHLTGVDLSPKMIEQAHARGIYHDLHMQEIVGFMDASQRKYDAVLSADVFIYIGDLDRVFASVSRCLVAGGLFVFSEESHLGDEPYHLRSSGRYAHSLPYLRDLSRRYGFEEISVDSVTIRLENGAPIGGYVIALKSTGSHMRADQ